MSIDITFQYLKIIANREASKKKGIAPSGSARLSRKEFQTEYSLF